MHLARLLDVLDVGRGEVCGRRAPTRPHFGRAPRRHRQEGAGRRRTLRAAHRRRAVVAARSGRLSWLRAPARNSDPGRRPRAPGARLLRPPRTSAIAPPSAATKIRRPSRTTRGRRQRYCTRCCSAQRRLRRLHVRNRAQRRRRDGTRRWWALWRTRSTKIPSSAAATFARSNASWHAGSWSTRARADRATDRTLLRRRRCPEPTHPRGHHHDFVDGAAAHPPAARATQSGHAAHLAVGGRGHRRRLAGRMGLQRHAPQAGDRDHATCLAPSSPGD